MRNAFSPVGSKSADKSLRSISNLKSKSSRRAKALQAAASFMPEALEGRMLLHAVTLDAIADTYVRTNSTSSTFGTSSLTCALPYTGSGCLQVRNDNGTNDGALSSVAYFKFDLSGNPGSINSAILQLVGVATGNPNGNEIRTDEVRGVNDNATPTASAPAIWAETGTGFLTSTNKASYPLDGGIQDVQTIGGPPKAYQWNVASWISSYTSAHPTQPVSLAVLMQATGTQAHVYRSREYGGASPTVAQKADRPKLIMSIGTPDIPATLTATAGNGQITLNWPATDANNYTILRSTSSGTETLYLDGIPTNSYVDTSVTNGVDYFYKVIASNNSGSSLESPEATARPLVVAAPAPSPLTVTEGIGTISFTWDAVQFADSYDVWRSDTSGTGFVKVSDQQVGTTYTETNVVPGQKIYYKVASFNTAGEGPLSPEFSATAGIMGIGTGLTGTFWDNQDFTGLSVSHIDPTVDFDYDACCNRATGGTNDGSPDPAIGPNQYSARWLGQVQAEYTQPYTFFTNSDDGIRMWLTPVAGGSPVLLTNAWVDRGAPPTDDQSVAVNLVAGQKYDVRIDFYENGGASNIRFRWQSPSTPKETVPMTQLYPDDLHARISAPPLSISTAPIDSNNVCLRWVDLAYDETGFVVERSTTADFSANVVQVPLALAPNTAACQDSTVTGGTPYYYRVKAHNALGDSAPTTAARATTQLVRSSANVTTATLTAHGMRVGSVFSITGASPAAFNGQFTVLTVNDANTITYANNGPAGTATNPGQLTVATVPSGTPGPINFASFPGPTNDLVLVNGASIADNRLRLVEALDNAVGAAWTSNVKIIDSFTSSFDFQFSNSNGADGFTFTIQGNGTDALGGGGGSLGYVGTTLSNSVAIKFDIYYGPNGVAGVTQTGVFTNGNANAGADNFGSTVNSTTDLVPNGLDFDGTPSGTGHIFHVDVSYDGATLLYTITDTTDRTKVASLQYPIDIAGTIGGHCAYIGFTAANGGLHARQDILNFNFNTSGPVINGTTANDTFYVRLNSPGGNRVHVWKNHDPATTPTPDYDIAKVDAANLALSGGRNNDTFTVDMSNGNPLPAGGLLLDGGQGTDTLTIKGTSAGEATSIDATTVTLPSGTFRHTGMDLGNFNLGDNVAGDGDDSLTVNNPGFSPQLNGGAGNNTLTVNGGTYTLGVDSRTGNNDGTGNATLNVVGSGATTINATGTQHVKSLTLNDTSRLNLTAGGTKLLRTNGLTLAPGATLDLNDNDAIIQSTAGNKLANWNTVMGLLRSGRTGGAWTGPGIRSNTAATLPTRGTNVGVILNDNGSGVTILPTFNGEAVDANTILLKYTYYGDRDFDGDVDPDDFAAIDAGFANRANPNSLTFPHQPSRDGDIDLNGAVDADDYFDIDKAFSSQSGVLGESTPMAASSTSISDGKAAAKKAHHKKVRHHQRSASVASTIMFRVRD